MIKIAIVDDEKKWCDEIYNHIVAYEKEKKINFELCTFNDGVDFIAYLDKGNQFDVVFMDIKMPDMNGLKAARLFRDRDKKACLIFTTVMAQYAVRGYEFDALDYMVKPITYTNLLIKLDKALKKVAEKNQHYTLSDEDGFLVRMNIYEIHYIKSNDHYCYFYTTSGEYKKKISISDLEKIFNEYGFMRCCVSYIINPAWVTKVTKEYVYIDNDPIPISRRKYKYVINGLSKSIS